MWSNKTGFKVHANRFGSLNEHVCIRYKEFNDLWNQISGDSSVNIDTNVGINLYKDYWPTLEKQKSLINALKCHQKCNNLKIKNKF